MSKISELTEATSAADDDLITIVDISDTSMAATGTNKKITKANLIGGGATGGATKTRTIKEKIATVTDPSGDITFDLSGHQAGDRIIIKGSLQGTAAANGQNMFLIMNGDNVAANYYRQTSGASDGNPDNNESASNFSAVVPGTTALDADTYGDFEIVIENYAGSNRKSAWVRSGGRRNTAWIWNAEVFVHSSVTAALTSLVISSQETGSGVGWSGSVHCYVESEETIGTGPLGSQVVKEEIARVTDPGAATIAFPGIPTNYDRLYLVGSLGTTDAGSQAISCFLNGDTTAANYIRQLGYHSETNFVASEGGDTFVGIAAGTGTLTSVLPLDVIVNDPGNASSKKMIWSKSNNIDGTNHIRAQDVSLLHNSVTGAITSITLTIPAGNFTGTLILYGERTL